MKALECVHFRNNITFPFGGILNLLNGNACAVNIINQLLYLLSVQVKNCSPGQFTMYVAT